MVTTTKIISIGKKDIIAKFTSDKRVRPNYNLSEDTVEKIEIISDNLVYKKAKFIDIYLNLILNELLKNLDKIKQIYYIYMNVNAYKYNLKSIS